MNVYSILFIACNLCNRNRKTKQKHKSKFIKYFYFDALGSLHIIYPESIHEDMCVNQLIILQKTVEKIILGFQMNKQKNRLGIFLYKVKNLLYELGKL